MQRKHLSQAARSRHDLVQAHTIAGILGLALASGACVGPGADDGEGETSTDTAADTDTGEDEGEACEPTAWWEFGLADPVLNEVALHYLGQAWHRSADVAEVLETISRVEDGDPWSWNTEWIKTAERLEQLAAASEADGHERSASQAYLRATTYYRASLHRHPDPFDPGVAELADREVLAFAKYLALSGSPCEAVDIPYEDTTLLGYLCVAGGGEPAPTLIFHEGKDGWAEDGKFVADEGLARGYNVLLFDGPGMGKTIRRQGLPFRHDWENVITPVVDYLVARPEVDPDRIGLFAVSMGGYFGPRAAAFETRLAALVANPGVIDWYAVILGQLDQIDPNLSGLLESDPAAFDATIAAIMEVSDFVAWGIVDAMWHNGQTKPSELMADLAQYRLDGLEQEITARTLVIDAEAEPYGQSLALYEAITAPKDYIMFTAEEAAQFHVQPGASGILTQRVYDWLDDNL
ncbi:alpha/beta hydrolase family protein [Enhygromyxa salina]|uniref:2,6-dihydropseudooxynicotine hydrolase n=1 Tax=Enhygromyxa salina TaxID=215803 RepID=A0A2S9YWF2_9BACT|nr:alpha/beta fold hydrolase [Enhygromyxa salina]PRQ09414.1 2,6-dihydropseudooxynicotine hydrolase [Enhygromyxa salina]